MIFTCRGLTVDDVRVVAEIEQLRSSLQHSVREPRRWTGVLSRNLRARALQGSNSIEGYFVTIADASAAVEAEEPLEADAQTWAEIVGYRTAMTYVQQLAGDQHFAYSEGLLRGLHFMLLGHDLSKSPGLYRTREIFVHDERTNEIVYTAPDAELAPSLVDELLEQLQQPADEPDLVRAALAHLNLVMVHPFRDGNGRMARALQTLVLARSGVLAPEFSSVEEYLGRNTQAYYDVLAEVGAGRWQPERDPTAWVSFMLRAHHIQAQTVRRRIDEASLLFARLDAEAARLGLPERVSSVLYDAALGERVRRSTYARDAHLRDGTATLDLRSLVLAGLLETQGETRGRTYRASQALLDLRREVRSTLPSRAVDPYVEAAPDTPLPFS